jgi:hypothetical protein
MAEPPAWPTVSKEPSGVDFTWFDPEKKTKKFGGDENH